MHLFSKQCLAIPLLLVLAACSSTNRFKKQYRQMAANEQAMADSLLAGALDHEALYTICDTLKPMSSVKLYRLPLFSANATQSDSAAKAMLLIQRIVNQLSFGDLQFVLNPFERRDSIYKNLEVYVMRKSRLKSMIQTRSAFYNQFGITSDAAPATVLAITEYENKYDRWTSYGYLFGYPAHAVEFFTNAGKQQETTGQFVKRDFFQIPVFAATSGHFTYAVPKDYKPTIVDSAIYNNAQKALNAYKIKRTKYATATGLKAVKLISKNKKLYNND